MQNQQESASVLVQSISHEVYNEHHYEELLGTEMFIEHFVKHNQRVGFDDRIMLID